MIPESACAFLQSKEKWPQALHTHVLTEDARSETLEAVERVLATLSSTLRSDNDEGCQIESTCLTVITQEGSMWEGWYGVDLRGVLSKSNSAHKQNTSISLLAIDPDQALIAKRIVPRWQTTTGLQNHIETWDPIVGTLALVSASMTHQWRLARLLISFGSTLDSAAGKTTWMVRVWEVDVPEGVDSLQWIAVASEPIEKVEDALALLSRCTQRQWYSVRH